MATGQVTTRVVIEGEDRATATIGKVRDELDKTKKTVENAAESAGNLERGFKGVKDIVGSLGGPFGEVADKFGGIEAVLQGMPGLFGPIALGAAAVGGVFAHFAEQAKNELEARIAAQKQHLDALRADSAALADHLGVSRQLLGVDDKGLTTQQQAMKIAQEVAAQEKELIDLRVAGNKHAERATSNAIAGNKEILAQLDLQLAIERRIADAKGLGTTRMEVRAAAADALEARAAASLNLQERTQLRQQALTERQTLLEEKRRGIWNDLNMRRLSELDAQKALLEVERDSANLDKTQQDIAAASVAKKATARGKSLAVLQAELALERSIEVAKEAAAQFDRDAADATRRAAADAAARLALEQARRGLDDRAAKATLDLAEDPAERARLQAMQIEAETARARADLERQTVLQGIDLQRAIAVVELEADARRATLHREQLARLQAERDAQIDLALGTASAAVAGLERIGLAERAAAGLKAIIAGAEAGLAFARGRYDQAVAGTVAALSFASVALGAGAPETPPSSPSPAAAPLPGGGAPGGAQGPANITINFPRGFVVGTTQQVGAAMQSALGSLGGTGMQKTGAM